MADPQPVKDTTGVPNSRLAHPYIPNSAPAVRSRMLATLDIEDIEEIFAEIPGELRLEKPLQLPPALEAEAELSAHMEKVLGKNRPLVPGRSFLGAGCYQHYVPAVCTEINSRAEFLTAYAGEAYEDHGKWQALYEYVSLMAELLDLDVVNIPTYDGYQAAATSLRMAGRVTGRSKVLVSESIGSAKLSAITAYLDGALDVSLIPRDRQGQADIDSLVASLDSSVAAVYIESPNAFGVIQTNGSRIAAAAHAAGALMVVGSDPISLGYLEPPANWGADIVCGDIQSLGLGMHFGGANGGFIASRDDERIVFEYPSRIFGLAPTCVPGEIGFVDIAYERTSLANREQGNEWVGTAAALWGITAGVYLSLMGPTGMQRLGSAIAARTCYAMEQLEAIDGVTIPFSGSPHWREFVMRLSSDTVSVRQLNRELLDIGIQGPLDITNVQTGDQLALVCVTEQHSQEDIDEFVGQVRRILK